MNFLKILKSWYLESLYWDEYIKISHKYIFHIDQWKILVKILKFVNSNWEEHMKMEKVLHN